MHVLNFKVIGTDINFSGAQWSIRYAKLFVESFDQYDRGDEAWVGLLIGL